MSDGHNATDGRAKSAERGSRSFRWRATPRLRRAMIVLAVLWIGSAYGTGFVRVAQERSRVDGLSAELLAMEERVSELQAEIEFRRTDAYVERVARRELGLVKPGEIRYHFVLPPDPTDEFYVPERPGDPPDPKGGY